MELEDAVVLLVLFFAAAVRVALVSVSFAMVSAKILSVVPSLVTAPARLSMAASNWAANSVGSGLVELSTRGCGLFSFLMPWMRMAPFAVPKELLPPLLPATRWALSRAKCAAVNAVFHPDQVLAVEVRPSQSGLSFGKDLGMMREREAMATSHHCKLIQGLQRAYRFGWVSISGM